MSLLAKSRHYFVNGSLIVPENGLLNLASDLHDTVYVCMNFQADNRCIFQMFVIDRSIVIGRFYNRIIMFLCKLFQGIYVRADLYPWLQNLCKTFRSPAQSRAVRTISADTCKVKLSPSGLYVSQYFGQFVDGNACGSRSGKPDALQLGCLFARISASRCSKSE